ncbi:MAG: purine/pyrimidine permease, partial [Micrococcus sp.]|nr:purine/pyrimidine permease [Micrococcus sp.]
LLGLAGGTVIAALMGHVNFSEVGNGSPVAFPTPMAFGVPTFDVAAILSMVVVILVIKTETAADLIAVGEIINTPVDSRRVADGLRADMLSSALAPIFGSFTQSAFAQNVGLVALTGVKSRWVVTAGGGIMVVLGLVPWLGQVVAAIPMPVLGGAGIVLFGTVAASGIRNLSAVKYEDNMNLVIVASALAFGMLPVVSPDFYANFPQWVQTMFGSGISSAAIVAFVLNIVFNEMKFGNSKDPSVFAAKPIRFLTRENLEALEDGDVFIDGKLRDCDGDEVPIVPDDKLDEVIERIENGEVATAEKLAQVVRGEDPVPTEHNDPELEAAKSRKS